MKNSKNVLKYLFGQHSIKNLDQLISEKIKSAEDYSVYFIDSFFKDKNDLNIDFRSNDEIIFVSTVDEPTTDYINSIFQKLIEQKKNEPQVVVGIGGGITLDIAKAISNLLTNGGRAEDYQGWDLVKVPGIFKIGIPTISGTGAEASRTCVMTNMKNGLKLGMNSEYTMYDQLVLDYELTSTVPKNQYFYTGMDTYIHCIESLGGSYRNAVADAFSEQALKLSRDVFFSDDMKSDRCREKLMTASYLGGSAIGNSFVGVVHPFSAGLSVVLKLHHGIANCVAMSAMGEFYPRETEEFLLMAEKQKVLIPKNVCKNLTNEKYEVLYNSTIIHEKPLSNALGENFKKILTLEKVIEIFKRM